MSTSLLAERESLLAEALQGVANELYMNDPADLIAYIRLEQYANLNDVVRSAMELYFKPDTLRFGYGGECLLDWGKAPIICLDMEFCHPSVTVQFRLLLGDESCFVQMDRILFAEASDDVAENTLALKRALAVSAVTKR